MPIFEYACQECGKVFEKLVLGKSSSDLACPHCGSRSVEQKFSAFATAAATPKPSGASCASASG
ncbi:MAG: zinc ribbon domain-containing protein [Acidobacteriia bacterium]|nr:zinc ribbon domain-containing protein [Terriglobia bacterium]